MDNWLVNADTPGLGFAREAGTMVVVGTLVFIGAMALAVSVIWLTIAPQWRRIARLAMGRVEQPFQPLGALARAERRIAVNRWASAPTTQLMSVRLRAAA